jgi:hypothetical protein
MDENAANLIAANSTSLRPGARDQLLTHVVKSLLYVAEDFNRVKKRSRDKIILRKLV